MRETPFELGYDHVVVDGVIIPRTESFFQFDPPTPESFSIRPGQGIDLIGVAADLFNGFEELDSIQQKRIVEDLRSKISVREENGETTVTLTPDEQHPFGLFGKQQDALLIDGVWVREDDVLERLKGFVVTPSSSDYSGIEVEGTMDPSSVEFPASNDLMVEDFVCIASFTAVAISIVLPFLLLKRKVGIGARYYNDRKESSGDLGVSSRSHSNNFNDKLERLTQKEMSKRFPAQAPTGLLITSNTRLDLPEGKGWGQQFVDAFNKPDPIYQEDYENTMKSGSPYNVQNVIDNEPYYNQGCDAFGREIGY